MEEFNIVEALLGITLLGTEWVLWLLIALSVISVMIIIERSFYFLSIRLDYADFIQTLTKHLSAKDWEKAAEYCKSSPALEAQTALVGIENRGKSDAAVDGSMEGFIIGQRHKLDRGLIVLGTLGNNAPFIGLFGTVIGIIMAFNDLALNPDGGPSVVMAGLSEALVATAIGIGVAIPAVVAFNAFNRIVKRRVADSEAAAKTLMTFL